MPSSFVNGYLTPSFQLVKNGTVYAQIDLPETNEGGLTETWTPVFKEHELWNNRIVRQLRGWRVTFKLDYTQFTRKDTLLAIKQILDYEKDGFDIYIIPRIDEIQRKFKVYFSGDSIDINIMRGGAIAGGNKSVEVSWTTLELQQRFEVIDPDLDFFICKIQSGLGLHVINPA